MGYINTDGRKPVFCSTSEGLGLAVEVIDQSGRTEKRTTKNDQRYRKYDFCRC